MGKKGRVQINNRESDCFVLVGNVSQLQNQLKDCTAKLHSQGEGRTKVRVCLCVYVYMCVFFCCVCMSLCVSFSLCMYACLCVYICVFMFVHVSV